MTVTMIHKPKPQTMGFQKCYLAVVDKLLLICEQTRQPNWMIF